MFKKSLFAAVGLALCWMLFGGVGLVFGVLALMGGTVLTWCVKQTINEHAEHVYAVRMERAREQDRLIQLDHELHQRRKK